MIEVSHVLLESQNDAYSGSYIWIPFPSDVVQAPFTEGLALPVSDLTILPSIRTSCDSVVFCRSWFWSPEYHVEQHLLYLHDHLHHAQACNAYLPVALGLVAPAIVCLRYLTRDRSIK